MPKRDVYKENLEVEKSNKIIREKNRRQFYFLDMFFFILSFYIILVALSHVDPNRAVFVFKQISQVLEKEIGLKEIKHVIQQITGIKITNVKTIQNIQAEWSSQLPFINQKLDSEKLSFRISFPYHQLIAENNVDLRQDRYDLMLRTANLLNIYGENLEQIYVKIEFKGPSIASQDKFIASEILALGKLANILNNEGVPSYAVEVASSVGNLVKNPILIFNFQIGPKIPKLIFFPANPLA